MISHRFIAVLAALAIAVPCAARAATQGSLGVTSTGTTVITIVVPEVLRISGINDFSLGTYAGTGSLAANDDLCVYDNSSSGSYGVRVTDASSMSPSGFSVQNAAATVQIPYTLRWNDQTGTVGSTSVSYGTRKSSAGANTQSTDCSVGGQSANLSIAFTQAALQAATSGGQYSTTIILTVEP